MHSNNPVFTRADGFNGRSTNAYGNTTYPASGMTYPGYGEQVPPPAGYPGAPQEAGYQPQAVGGRMTIDTVVQKTGITLAVLVVTAGLTWLFTGDVAGTQAEAQAAMGSLYLLALVGALGGFVLALVNSFKKVISPPLVLAYAVLEGVFVGAFSKVFEAMWPGIVVSAVIGTFAAAAGTLAAYKFFNIQVSDRFRKFVVAAMFGFVGLALLNFVLGFFGADFGMHGFGMTGLVFSVIGLAIGILMLILDFDFVERGVAAGLPEQESWRAAFGLAVTLVWIYIELMRIIAILRGQD